MSTRRRNEFMPNHRKLTAAQCMRIRMAGHIGNRRLARDFQVSPTTIQRIKAGTTYADIARSQAELPLPLPANRYATVVMDPHWPIGERSAAPGRRNAADYPTMRLREIAGLPVNRLLDASAFLCVWTTSHFLPDAMRMLAGWGVAYKYLICWDKGKGVQATGYPAYTGEYLVVAGKGRPRLLDTRDFPTVISAPRSQHSVKPDRIYRLLERVMPAPRIDLFSRQPRPGFDCWELDIPGGYQARGSEFAPRVGAEGVH